MPQTIAAHIWGRTENLLLMNSVQVAGSTSPSRLTRVTMSIPLRSCSSYRVMTITPADQGIPVRATCLCQLLSFQYLREIVGVMQLSNKYQRLLDVTLACTSRLRCVISLKTSRCTSLPHRRIAAHVISGASYSESATSDKTSFSWTTDAESS